MSELSTIGIITKALELAKARKVGVQFTYFDVIELIGHIKALEEYNHTDIVDEMSVVVKNQKSLGDEVMEIIQAALSGDCQKYLSYDLQGNKYCKWGIVEKDIRALFETSTDNNKGE